MQSGKKKARERGAERLRKTERRKEKKKNTKEKKKRVQIILIA